MRALGPVVAFLPLLAACAPAPVAVPPGAVASAPSAPSPPLPNTVPTDVPLPATRATTPLGKDAIVVVISRARLALDAGGPTLAQLDPSRWDLGLDGRYKQGGQRGLLILPLAAALVARGLGDAGAAPPVVIAADASVPYAVLTEVVFTLGAYSLNDVSLLGRGDAGVATAAIRLPRRGANGFPVSAAASLDFMVKIDDAGFVVSVRGKPMAPGCHAPAPASDAGGGLTIPKANGSFDDARLAACASEIKGSAGGTSDRSATLFAELGSDVQTVVEVLDALRGENSALFPEVALGIVRR
jgi:hypothetical protein